MTHLTWLLVALPAAGAAILLLGGRRTDPWGHWLGCADRAGVLRVGLSLLIDMLGRHGDARTIGQNLFSWIPVNGLQVDFGLQIDQLSICFVLLITGVGSLIHIYSVAYMAEDPDRRRFFAYLNLFLAAMLLLVVADNLRGPLRRLGRRGSGVLPADRVLVPQADRGDRRQEGLRDEPGRRRRAGAGDLRDLRQLRHAVLLAACSARRRAPATAR